MNEYNQITGKGWWSLLVLAFLHFACQPTPDLPQGVAQEMEQITRTVDYTFDIKPILSDRCFACHGPDVNKMKGELRLDVKEIAYSKKSEQGFKAIVPGKPWKSELVHRILSLDPDMVMPTPESHLTLTDREKALLIKWIEQGATYKPHWAFAKIERPKLPEVKNESWVKNEIDRFILSKLEENNLKPLPEADKTTLLRRVYMDLIGLPPTPEEVQAFLQDKSLDAYERVVDKLLASPHFGEHMAVPWLDVARYADTHGYQDDMMRTAWPYREWVINAYNKNLPYDQFITWQLAGDLLPNPAEEQLLATAFNRMHQQSMEGGIISEEYRTEYVADRVNTFGVAFLGLTTECARCHDHKYDPISQKDYFSLYAFFNNINENGQIPYNGESSPAITLPTPEAKKQLHAIKQVLEKEEKKREQLKTDQRKFTDWLSKTAADPEKFTISSNEGLYGYFTFDEPQGRLAQNQVNPNHAAKFEGDEALSDSASIPGKFGRARRIFGENGVDFGKEFAYFERNQPFTVSIWLRVMDESLSGPIIHKSNHITSGYRGWNIFREKDGTFRLVMSYVWPDNCIELHTENPVPTGEWVHIAFSYDGLSKADGLMFYVNGEKAPVRVVNDNLTQSILYGKNKTNITVNNMRIGRQNDVYTKNFDVDELKIFTRYLTPLEMRSLYTQQDEVVSLLKSNPEKASTQELEELQQYYLHQIASDFRLSLEESRQKISEETELLNSQIDVMVMKERKYPRKTYILERGVYDAPGEEVTPDTPDSFFKIPAHYPKNRLGLAQWLLDEDHPLFSRVTVNRFWQQYFGKGLVTTVGDFGNQGSLPTHPELLDWLASEFMNSDKSGKWNVKAFQKMIVMSATYRQASYGPLEHIEADPENIYFSRGPSFRLSAEQIRDNALTASGLINRTLGGESVYPYQPPGIWEQISNYGKYRQQKGDTLYRRSMYTIWKRTAPPPMMLNFDASERHFCVVKRQKTSTPLQSLVIMNDPQFVEASRVLAQHALRQAHSIEQRINYAFIALTGRPVKPEEVEILKGLFEEEYQRFEKAPEKVKELLAVGEYPVDSALPPTELAAYTIVTSTIMNFDEFAIKR